MGLKSLDGVRLACDCGVLQEQLMQTISGDYEMMGSICMWVVLVVGTYNLEAWGWSGRGWGGRAEFYGGCVRIRGGRIYTLSVEYKE